MFPKTGPLWRQIPISRALFSISSRDPQSRSSPSSFPPQSSHRERCPVSRALLHSSFTVPGKWAPLQVPHRGPYGTGGPSPEPLVYLV